MTFAPLHLAGRLVAQEGSEQVEEQGSDEIQPLGEEEGEEEDVPQQSEREAGQQNDLERAEELEERARTVPETEGADQNAEDAGEDNENPAQDAEVAERNADDDLEGDDPSGAGQAKATLPAGESVDSVAPADLDHALPTESERFREAYRVLTEAETSGDADGLDPVKALFEDEIDAGRNLARAHNGLGRYYLQQHEHVIIILESIQKLFNWDHITQARKNFRLATETDPAYVEAWYNWAVAGRKAKDGDALGEAASALRHAVALDPGYRDAYRLLVVTLRDLEDYPGAELALSQWRASDAASSALANLEESYLRMGVRDDAAGGARLYWEGLAAAGTADEVDAYFEDLEHIASGDERKAYQGLDVEGRKGWIESFWQRAADQAVVTRDERLAEHYHRVAHVERNYALMIPQRRHYSAISAYRPREQSGFDDRGIIYLRHGEPDDLARFTGPNVQRNESWRYVRPDGDLVFHFVSDEDTEDFKLVRSLADALVRSNATLAQRRGSAENVGELFESRSSFDPVYNRLAFQFDPMLLREEEEDVARDVKVGTTTASYVPASPDSLPFYAYPAAFRDISGEPEVSVYFGVPTSALEMPPGGAGPRLAYAAHMLIEEAESGERVAARAADSVAVEVPGAVPRDVGVLVPDVLRSSVPKGEYRYRLRVRDLFSRDTGTLAGEIEVPELGGFSASSLVLASRVEPGSSGGKFSRGDLKVVPLPSLAFRPGQPVFVYYEVYGLTPGEDGRVRYSTEYTVRARERKRNIAVKLVGAVGNLLGSKKERGEEVGLTVQGEAAQAERLREYISLDLNESEPGPYEIGIEVKDLVAGKKVERRAPFVLVK